MKENEFSFELTAGNQAAINGLTDNSIVFGTDTESNSMTTTAVSYTHLDVYKRQE